MTTNQEWDDTLNSQDSEDMLQAMVEQALKDLEEGKTQPLSPIVDNSDNTPQE